jgi:hypothetical protein
MPAFAGMKKRVRPDFRWKRRGCGSAGGPVAR